MGRDSAPGCPPRSRRPRLHPPTRGPRIEVVPGPVSISGGGEVTTASQPSLPGPFDARERDVLERIACGAPLGEVLERIVRFVEGQAPGMRCSILLLDRAHGCVRY